MLLGIISDTHDRLIQLRQALEFFHTQRVEQIIHCGDWKSLQTVIACAEQAYELGVSVYGVLGNNDIDVPNFMGYAAQAPGDFKLFTGVLTITLGNKQVAAYHGHHRPTRQWLIDDASIDILLLGHTHKPLIQPINKRLLVNPGSTAFAIPRSKSWQPSVALVDTDTMSAKLHYLD